MSIPFTKIAFTDSVKAAQTAYGTRQINARRENHSAENSDFTEYEATFIAQRDSFYQATVSDTGWPYIQHRGGAKGFLKVLDKNTLAYADYRGNLQYLSVGNLTANDKISLILMDYPNRARLKIWGYARIADAENEPEIFNAIKLADGSAKIERAIIIHLEAYDWNCPQYIVPRYTEEELLEMFNRN